MIHRRIRAALAAVALVLGAAAAGHAIAGFVTPAEERTLAERLPAVNARQPVKFSPRDAAAPRSASAKVVARAREATVRVYRRRGSGKSVRRLAARELSGRRIPLVFLVKAQRRGWLEVYLPVRPNGSTGWIRRRDVTLAETTYRVRIDVARHRLTVWRGKRVVARERVGTGTAVTPTPAGRYYVTDLVRPPDPSGLYGPYAFGLSAHSPVLTNFGGGPGQVGIHGTNEPWLLGTDVSHGCIRIRNEAITRLARRLPLGTPVRIVNVPRSDVQKTTAPATQPTRPAAAQPAFSSSMPNAPTGPSAPVPDSAP